MDVQPATAPLSTRRASRLAPRLAAPKVLLCDLDGTLIDTMPILADLATDVLEEVYGMDRKLARDMYLTTCGLPFIRQLDAICPGDGRNQAASDRFEAAKPARCNTARLTTETRWALEELRSRGVAVVVSSNNGTENVNTFVAHNRFPFDMALGYGNGLAKGRTHVELAMKHFGVRREDLMFVGDSLHDGDIADQEELRFIGVAGTFSRERFVLKFPKHPVVDQFAHIPDLFWPMASAAGL
ncbi:MAG: HAD hydrolase-like protein [Myxococcales bacterium]|nr:HAD hydrolase-like protein [Myxococcales bacterium]